MAAALDMPLRFRLAMVACGYVPFLNVVVMGTVIALAATGVLPRWTAWLAPAWLLLVPPIVVRLTMLNTSFSRVPKGRAWLTETEEARPFGTPLNGISLNSNDFLLWWFASQWQAIFNRLPIIEETMRLVPGLYSAWLRLWGARVGRFVYWTPGLRILDRSLLDVGDGAAFGAGVRINPHVLLLDADGRPVLRVGTVRIGAGALVGGYALLTAGCWIADDEATPANLTLRPFGGWRNGRRVKPKGDGDAE